MVANRRLLQLALRQQLGYRVLRRYKGAADGCRAGAAIGLQHITVKMNGALAQLGQVKHGAHAAPDQALDFLRPAALLAACRFPVAAGMGGAWQHAVFGRHPAFAAALLVRRHLFFH